eukprot:CAMPEP_0119289966 /NCGR_PEP_ID=MMETSP1329-20130426/39936_1 /TAXON_ID=114041 /ORGANISM="Genus nov. species nov., Strain RCC1024" /LENGTH=268 /DNA_ID=CAMNT_0007290781 /DNA_START=75 /DNA_END=878 /DNA_ORIENTATION=+
MAANIAFTFFAIFAPTRALKPLHTVVVSNCGSAVGSCCLDTLRSKTNVAVRALAATPEEAAKARMNACGAKCGGGSVGDLCTTSYPHLETVVATGVGATREAVAGATALVILTDDAHPWLRPLPSGDAVVDAPRAYDEAAERCDARARRLVDAAAAESVPHVVLVSCLDAEALPLLLKSRAGAPEVAQSRRALESRLVDSGLRHTILRAPPIIESEAQLRALDEAVASDDPPALITQTALARAALNAALDLSGASSGLYEVASTRRSR